MPGEAIDKTFNENIGRLRLFSTYLISLKTEVTSPELGPIVNLAAGKRQDISTTVGTTLQPSFTVIYSASWH